MIVLFVHGMGRSPLSGWPLLHQLHQSGLTTQTFGYIAALENFNSIVSRLRAQIEQVANLGPYIVIGHSLGGVLLRAALNTLHQDTPPPTHLYLLGSPIIASRLATKLKDNILFRLLTGDCGQLLGSAERMRQIGSVKVPTTAIAGVRGFTGKNSPFGQELNDSVVAISEVSADWFSVQIQVPVVHTLLPASAAVATIILDGPTTYIETVGEIPFRS